LVAGKPNPLAFNKIKEGLPDIAKERFVMVGDKLDTDILFGQRAGIDTVLVLSGVTASVKKAREIVEEKRLQMPTYVMEAVGKEFN